MKVLIGLLFALGFSTSVYADQSIVAESDTGIVYGDLNCRGTDYEVGEVRVGRDYFDYLEAQVSINIDCVDRRGRHHIIRGSDVVKFLTLTFDWETQNWVIDDTVIASRSRRGGVELNRNLDLHVWTNFEETHVAFKVQFKTAPEAK